MTPDEATAVINNMTEYPRRRLTADVSGPSHITITSTIMDGADSSDPPSYLTPLRPMHSERFDVREWHDDAEVVHAVVETELAQMAHELREFHRLPYAGGWVAPCHPHTAKGTRAWSRVSGEPIERDLNYNARG